MWDLTSWAHIWCVSGFVLKTGCYTSRPPDPCAERIAKTLDHRTLSTGLVMCSSVSYVGRFAKRSHTGRWAPDSLQCVRCFVRKLHSLPYWPWQAPDTHTIDLLRPMQSVRCTLLSLVRHPVHLCTASGECYFQNTSIGVIERNLNPSLPFNLHLLLKVCQHHQVCTNECTCVSIFTIIFFEEVKLAY